MVLMVIGVLPGHKGRIGHHDHTHFIGQTRPAGVRLAGSRLASKATSGCTPTDAASLTHWSNSMRRSPAGLPAIGAVNATSYGATARPSVTRRPAQAGSTKVSPSESAIPTLTAAPAAGATPSNRVAARAVMSAFMPLPLSDGGPRRGPERRPPTVRGLYSA